MITRRSLFGLTFGGAVATALPASPGKPQGVNATGSETAPGSSPTAPPMRITFGRHGHACKVEVEGVDISRYCRSAVVSAHATDVTVVSLDMYLPEGAEVVCEPGAVELVLRDGRRRIEDVRRLRVDDF